MEPPDELQINGLRRPSLHARERTRPNPISLLTRRAFYGREDSNDIRLVVSRACPPAGQP